MEQRHILKMTVAAQNQSQQRTMTYKATLGATSIIVTAGISLLLGLLFIFFLYRAISADQTALSAIFITVVIAIATLYLVTYLYRPAQYLLDSDHLTIKRPLKDVKIPISEISNAFLVKKESMKWTERIGGNGGLFGFYGNFRNNFGVMTWYATKLGNYIMIETMDNSRIIITPDNNTEMIKEIRRLIGK